MTARARYGKMFSSCGFACVSDGEKIGYIKRDGEVAIPFIYDDP